MNASNPTPLTMLVGAAHGGRDSAVMNASNPTPPTMLVGTAGGGRDSAVMNASNPTPPTMLIGITGESRAWADDEGLGDSTATNASIAT